MSTILNAQVAATEPPSQTQNITENTTCLILNFGSIGIERKVREGQVKQRGVEADAAEAPVEVDADTEMVRVSKRLIVSAEFDAIQRGRRELTRWIKRLTVPSLFKEGVYRVHFRAVSRITDRLREFIPQDQERVRAFLAVYRQRCDESREKLKALGELTDYPPVAKVEKSFFVDYHWMTFSTDEKLKQEVGEEFFREEQQRAEVKVSQATDAIVLMMRQELQEMWNHLSEVLAPNEDGTKKRFHASTVTKIKEFLDNLPLRNVTNDQQLTLVADSIKMLLDGVDMEQLRKDETVRDNMAKGAVLVKHCLDSLVVEAGSRRIFFGPEAEAPAAPPDPTEADDEDAFAEVQ